MSTASLVTSSPELPTVSTELEDVREFMASSISPATLRAYRSGLNDFQTWCDTEGVRSMPATQETVARYLASLAKGGKKVAPKTKKAQGK